MRAVLRVAFALGLLGAGSWAAVGNAAGDGVVSVPLSRASWYWHPVSADAPAAGVPSEPSAVPKGDLPVASRDGKGTPSKLTLLGFALPADSADGTVSAFDLTLTIDPSATNVVPSDLKVVVAPAQRDWLDGGTGQQDVSNAPPVDDTAVVDGTLTPDGKAVLFHASAVAQHWLSDVNYGLEVLPKPGYATPFQVSFLGRKSVTASMSYSPGGPTGTGAAPGGPGSSSPGSLGGTSPSTAGGAAPAGSTSLIPLLLGSAPSDASSGTASLLPGLPATAPSVAGPQAAPAPAVAPATVAAAEARPLAVISGSPPGGLIVTGGLLLGLLVLVSLLLGSDPEVSSVTEQPGLPSVLRHRATARLTAPDRPL